MKKLVKVLALSAVICTSSLGVSYNNPTSKTVYADTTTTATTETTETTTEEVDLSPKAREFTKEELSEDYSLHSTITLADNASKSTSSYAKVSGNTITITGAGVYELSGSLTDGQIIVDVEDDAKVQLVLNGVTINNDTSSPIYVKNAKDYVMITLKDGTTNILTDGETYDLPATEDDEELDATIYSKDDLVINGNGTLNIDANYNDAIKSNDNLYICSGDINITSKNDAIYGKDSITILDGNFNVTTNEGSAGKEMVVEQFGGGGMGGKFQMNADGTVTTPDGQTMTPPTFTQDGSGQMTPPDFAQDGQGGQRMMPPDFAQNGQSGQMMTPPDFAQNGQSGQMMTPPEFTQNGQSVQGMTPPTFTQNGQTAIDSTKSTTTTTTDKTTTVTTEETTTEEESNSRGFKSKGEIVINDGTFTLDTYDDSINAGTFLEINGGTFDIKSGDDAIKADYILTINDGDINISYCYEGIESQQVHFNGGDVDIVSVDDGINATSATSTSEGMPMSPMGSDTEADPEVDPIIYFDGSNVKVVSSGDSIDSNGGIYVNDGIIEIHGVNNGGELALDFDKRCAVNGGTIIVLGGAGNISSTSTQNVFSTSLDSTLSKGSTVKIYDSNGATLYETTLEKDTNAITFSSSKVNKGETYTIASGTTKKQITTSTTSTVTNNAKSGMGMGGGQRPQRNTTTDATSSASLTNKTTTDTTSKTTGTTTKATKM